MLRSSLRTGLLANTIIKSAATAQTRANVHRWVAPTLRELRRRAKLIGPQQPQARSSFIEWNYRAELFAFGKRLQEHFQLPLLQTAFTERSYVLQQQQQQRELGIEEADQQMSDNRKLAEQGLQLARKYVEAFLKHERPKVPEEGVQAVLAYLLRASTLAHIALNLGVKELINCDTYPPTEEAYAHVLMAIIGALAESSGVEPALLFVRDFICTQLNQRDLTEIWQFENPVERLSQFCSENGLAPPEPRLIGDCGKHTILAAYQVGIYSNKKLLGQGFGENVQTAIETASLDALLKQYELTDSMRPFNFQLQILPESLKHSERIQN